MNSTEHGDSSATATGSPALSPLREGGANPGGCDRPPGSPLSPEQRIAALERTLKFYADGLHFSKGNEGDWDTVSGEPQNFWCDEHGNTIEDGSIARAALEGRYVIDEDDDEKQPELPL